MSFEEAVAQQPAWVGYWLNWLLVGAFILPLALLIWRQTRIAGVVTIAASVVAAFSTMWLYEQMGYVKLLGLPHIVFWTPVVVYLIRLLRGGAVPLWPRVIIMVIVATILVSLAFDYVDVARWLLGERQSFATPPAA